MMGVRWSRKYENVDDAIRTGDWDAVGFLLRSDARIDDIYYVSREIGRHGSFVQDLRDRGCTHYYAIAHGAAKGGHRHVIELMIEIASKSWTMGFGTHNYVNIACEAAISGQMEIVKWMIDLGADQYGCIAESAAYNGHIEIVDHMIGLGADDYDSIILSALYGGRKDVIDWMRSKRYV